jgi:phosphoribosyl 1,2-cyclic phosphodiesterase
MKIRFWGVRGSIPAPGPETVKYGGNTLCVELCLEEAGRRIIIDAGTGLRELGNYLVANDLQNGPIQTEIFVTHTHWDHIMGFPFFAPIYIPSTRLKVYGPVTYEEETLDKVVGGQLTYRYFPVRQAELSSHIEYIPLKESQLDLGDGILLTTKYLNHPVLCLGYRFEYRGRILCTAYDTEPFRNVFITDPDDLSYDEAMAQEGEVVAMEENQRLESFFANADLLIHDTQYTQEEYESSKLGWGHSSFEHAIAAAKRSEVKRLAFFHHDPMRTDAQIDELAGVYCRKDVAGDVDVFFAKERMEIEL